MQNQEINEKLNAFIAPIKESLRTPQLDSGNIQTRFDTRRNRRKSRLMLDMWYLEVNFAQLREAIENANLTLEAAALSNILGRMKSLSNADRRWIQRFLPERDIPGNLRFIIAHYSLPKPE